MGKEYYCDTADGCATANADAYTEIFEDQAIIFDFMSVTYRLFWLLFGFGGSSDGSSSGNQIH